MESRAASCALAMRPRRAPSCALAARCTALPEPAAFGLVADGGRQKEAHATVNARAARRFLGMVTVLVVLSRLASEHMLRALGPGPLSLSQQAKSPT